MESSNVIAKKLTLIERAKLQVSGFDAMWHRLGQAINLRRFQNSETHLA